MPVRHAYIIGEIGECVAPMRDDIPDRRGRGERYPYCDGTERSIGQIETADPGGHSLAALIGIPRIIVPRMSIENSAFGFGSVRSICS